jgi:hypothetical protein
MSLGLDERCYYQRKGSFDNRHSILSFIDQKINEVSRQRIMSE